jgi:hypothetical protein
MKMKKVFYSLAIAVWAAIIFTSCTGSEYAVIPENLPLTGEENPLLEEEPTYATFTFRLGDTETGTRAPMQTGAYEPAGAITTFGSIRLLVFEVKANDTGLCLADSIITSFGVAGNPPQGQSATMLVRSGQKRVLVIANTAGKTEIDNQLQGLQGITYADFLSACNRYDIGAPDTALGLPVASLDFSKLVKTGDPASSMVYSNSTADSSIFTIRPTVSYSQSMNGRGPDDNHFEVTLQRPVAKVTVTTAQTSPIQVSSGKGHLQDLEYSIHNVNRSLYLFQRVNSLGAVSPNNQFQPQHIEDDCFFPYFYRGYDFTALQPASSPAAPVYVTENVQIYHGATTYAAVKAVYVPKLDDIVADFSYNILSEMFENITHPVQYIPGTDFYQLYDLDNNSYYPFPSSMLFIDRVKAYKAAYCIKYGSESGFDMNDVDDLDQYVWKYTGGKCYYRIDFRDPFSRKRDIVRNHHYRLTISSFTELGDNDLPKAEPGGTDEQPTYITASVTVLPWIEDDYVVPGASPWR